MTISEKNIVKRWNMMASKDLGYDRNPEARGFAELFSSMKDMESRNLDYSYSYFEQEIHRAYMILEEQAELQNDMDINQWFKDGMIYEHERDSLKRYNRTLYKRMTAAE